MIGITCAMIDTEDEKREFVALYEGYRKLMFYVANDILRDHTLAEDAVQEAFLRIVKNFRKIGDISCPRTKAFVVIITKNTAKTLIAKENRAKVLHENLLYTSAQPADDTFSDVSYRSMVRAMLQLPEIHRDVLYLAHIYGYNYKEISSLLSISVEAVKKRMQRSKARLKEVLGMEKEENHE